MGEGSLWEEEKEEEEEEEEAEDGGSKGWQKDKVDFMRQNGRRTLFRTLAHNPIHLISNTCICFFCSRSLFFFLSVKRRCLVWQRV